MICHTMMCLWLAAVPLLGNACQADEPAPGDPVSDGKPLSAWIKALKDPAFPDRFQAAQAIGRLGPRAKAAVPALREALLEKTGPVPFAAGAALWKVDRETFTRLLTDGAEAASRARFIAVLSLPSIGADAKELAPLVLKMATDEREPNREHALLALGYIGADPAEVLPVLTAALQDERSQYGRMLSAQALGHLGPKAKDALPALHQALADPDPQVRVDAANAVWQIERDAGRVVPVLAEALKGGADGSESAARHRAVRGLRELGPAAMEAFPALLGLWQAEQSESMKASIAKALKAVDAKAAREAGVK
jgi:HEAT repeat protein